MQIERGVGKIKFMAEQLLPYALTTLQRVKDRIFDTNTGASQPSSFDSVLIRMINSSTDWFEKECNGRRFVYTLFKNEIYSANSYKQTRVILKNAPIFFLNANGNMTLGSPIISSVNITTGMVVGMPVLADNFPMNTTISAISGSDVTLSASATSSETGGYFQVNGIMAFQWRPGTPSNPSWFDFILDQYQVVNDGKAGIIRIYGWVPMTQDNTIRVSYYAGYPVDWANAGNNTTHQLPASISDTVENMVVRRFKRRTLAGKGAEGLEGATTSWNKEIDAEDQDVIGHWRRMPTIF